MPEKITPFLDAITATAKSNFHRYTIVIGGEQSWCLSQAEEIEKHLEFSNTLWVSKQPLNKNNVINPSQVRRILGMEFHAVFFDAHSGFDPDVFAAIAGTIVGGGILIILGPPLEHWPQFEDPEKSRIAVWPYYASDISGRFLKLVAERFQKDDGVFTIRQERPFPVINEMSLHAFSETPARSSEPTMEYCRTMDQQRAVEAILHVVSGHRHRPLVITSDRGRGKSSALGIAAAALFNQGVHCIVVTAPHLAAVSSVFEIAEQCLPPSDAVQQKHSKGKFCFGDSSLQFVPPDELLHQHYDCNLLMVDEAAAIPTHILERLLKTYSRIVFATTVHGYEGTGRGFVLRFQNTLEQITPDWRAFELNTPIRWAGGDPLERLVFRALLLDAQAAPDDVVRSADATQCVFQKLDRDALLEDKTTLSQLFGLLVLAHYQTQPADLRYLLDARDIKIYILKYKNSVVAAALLEDEGHIDAGMSEKIYANQRRLRGHLMAQTMAVYVGIPHAPRLKYARVMRIAVHPLAQHKGIGTHFIKHIEHDIRALNYDLWGASFGATSQLIRFWRDAGFSPVHLGLKRNTSSGMHAVLVLRPISENGMEIYQRAQQKFIRHLPHLLGDVYKDLEASLVKALFVEDNAVDLCLTEEDIQDIVSYVVGNRGYEVNAIPLWKLVCYCLQNNLPVNGITEIEQLILVAKVLQKKSWPEVVRICEATGAKQARSVLRAAVDKLFSCYSNNNAAKG